jgi:DNA polymerase III, delta subunit
VTPQDARQLLSQFLPQAVLLLGPGSWKLGAELGQLYGLAETVTSLDAAAARQLRDQAQYEPVHSPAVYLVRLDGSSPAAQNMLLKLLEEPPSWTRFLLTATREPLPTIVSRCQVMPLTAEPEARDGDSRARGQVAVAVKAARNGSQLLLTQALKGWGAEHGQVLQDWAYEAAAGRWRQFAPGFAPGVTQLEALALLELLAKYAGSKLGPVVALAEVFSPQ